MESRVTNQTGSSPLTRGKLPHRPQQVQAAGLIPAHAGKTDARIRRLEKRAAHPRSRGENIQTPSQTVKTSGSSPLTRGKHTRRKITRDKHGLIPAHAGKTCFWSCLRVRSRAHPRSRGENLPVGLRAPLHGGSSPLTRGKHPDDGADGGRMGLIPAHAGKTGAGDFGPGEAAAHPRSRGENQSFFDLAVNGNGSSPLTRGKPFARVSPPAPPGLIPAHAGKTVT